MPAASKSETPVPEIMCRYHPQGEGVRLWESVNGPVPPDMRVGWDVQGCLLRKLDPMRLVKRKESALARLRSVRQRGGQIETWAVVHSARPTPSESSTPSVFPGTFRAAWYP